MANASTRGLSGGSGLVRGAVRLGSALAVAFVLGPAAHAAAAGGDLELIDCIGYEEGASCGSSIPGLATSFGGPSDLALSPDESSLYVVSRHTSALLTLDRDPATGELTPAGCLEDEDHGVGHGAGGCTATTPGLKYARSVAVSPDGQSVYVAGQGSVSHFASAADGALALESCVTTDTEQDCDVALDEGLELGGPIVISPDGNSLYARGEHSVVSFDLGLAGELVFDQCLTARMVPEYPGGGPSPGTCTQSSHGLFGAAYLAISPGGDSLYVVATGGGDGVGSDAIVLFDRDPETAELAEQRSGYLDNIPEPTSFAVAPDGRSAYLTTEYFGHNEAVTHFRRDPVTGELSWTGCLAGDGCYWSDLFGAPSIAGISPDSRSVYTSSSALVLFAEPEPPFDWESYKGCTVGPAEPCRFETPVVPRRLAFTSDGATAYGVGGSVLSRWRRETDTYPPRVEITLLRKQRGRAWFRISANEPGSTFTCRVNAAKWRRCGSRVRTRVLKSRLRAHKFRARAGDPAGNPSLVARRYFRIKR